MGPIPHLSGERPPTTGFKSNTRADAGHTNRTLQKAAQMTLRLPKPEQDGCLSERGAALRASKNLTASLTSSQGSNSARLPPPLYASLGEYRPAMQKVQKPEEAGDVHFQEMLAMIGEKVRQKFSKARDVFRFIDSDHSGTISRSEVYYFFRFFNVPESDADTFFDGFEIDEDGEIAYVEFVKYLWPHVNPGNEQQHWSLAKDVNVAIEAKKLPTRIFVRAEEADDVELPNDLKRARMNIAGRLELRYKNSRDAFRDLDYSRDGKITQEEMRGFFKNFGWEEMAERFWVVLDRRGHGTVDFATFARLFAKSGEADLRMRL